jgi:5-methylcytosine-specific restriction endonuclease McrA
MTVCRPRAVIHPAGQPTKGIQLALRVKNLENIPAKQVHNQIRKSLSPALRKRIYERDGGTCCLCKEKTRFFNSLYDSPFNNGPKAGSVDHIVPRSKGGSDDEDNLRWMCRSCNCARGNRE